MVYEIELQLTPEEALNSDTIMEVCREECRFHVNDTVNIRILRRSIDARRREPMVSLLAQIYVNEEPPMEIPLKAQYQKKNWDKTVLIVGAGPAGYFAALELIALGIKPVIFERGKDVRTRRRDLRAIQQFGEVNPDSNYCFGEGGAGAYSDGKLYTRSDKRGDVRKILQILVEHGAQSEILYDAHPHIGSNKLPQVVAAIRETILNAGGEVHFDARVTDLILRDGKAVGVIVNAKDEYFGSAVLLATGHSARDIFYMLDRQKVRLEMKPFALGVRVEHPQELIDEIQYHQKPRSSALPASSYKLVAQVEGRGVFSFCMCPGGIIVPAATAPGEIVVNGMSMSRRDSFFANSGIVTAIEEKDVKKYAQFGAFAGLKLQEDIEKAVFQAGDGSQKAPAQRVADFIHGRVSASLVRSSYIPGVFSAGVHELFPQEIARRLQAGFVEFGKKMKGFLSESAQVVAVESRTSSPVRIPRNRETLEHTEIKGLYPCGEGAGYAGGIVSAALDGENSARAIARAIA